MTPTDLRLRLLANGYAPLPNVGKTTFLRQWPSLPITAEVIESWRRRSRWADTGIRIENGLCVLDLDINHDVADDIADLLEETEPSLSQALLRFGKGFKRAWFFRVDEPFGRIASRRWLAPDADLDRDGAHCVEAFGGASPRQFGAIGAHTRGANGDVEIAYEWANGDDPLVHRLEHLPEMPKARLFKLVDAIEERLQAAGFTPVARTVKGEMKAARSYDLRDDMRFECNDGVTRSLEELQAAAGEPGLRCSASWLEPGAGHSLTRCIVGVSHTGTLTLWDAAYGVTHMPEGSAEAEGDKAREERRELMARYAEKMAQLKTQRQTTPSSEDSAAQVAAKLIRSYAWCPTRQLQVVPFWSTSTEAGMTLTNFRTTMLPYAEIEIGPRGGEKKVNPADLWVSAVERETVAGLQLRPDMPRPLFKEHGEQWVNTYDPEIHEVRTGVGDVAPGLALLEQLLPDLSERRWFAQWLAHKYRFPHVPGPAVVMVARQHGTGRGTLGELVKAIFGARYVKTVGFDHFAGRTYQSQYTEWQADSLVTIVNESSTADAGSAYRTKHDTYERLKEIVDPRAADRQIIAKGLRAYRARVCASYLIFTNNPDALPLPAGDRRFWVGTNGEPREPAFWDEIARWMAVQANVAAFAGWLADMDLAGFNPYAVPPMTAGKEAMTELSASDLDRAFADALSHLPGEVLTPEHIWNAMRSARDVSGYEFPEKAEGLAKKIAARQLYRIGERHGQNWFLKHEGKRYSVYARTSQQAARWTKAEGRELRREALKNGEPTAVRTIGDMLNGLRTVAGKDIERGE